jgi:hypothetical protein
MALGARWTMFIGGLLPCLAGLAGLALKARQGRRDAPSPAPAEAA